MVNCTALSKDFSFSKQPLETKTLPSQQKPLKIPVQLIETDDYQNQSTIHENSSNDLLDSQNIYIQKAGCDI